MRVRHGFTLLELMIVLVVMAVVGAVVVYQGRSARQAASISGGAFELALLVGAVKARALSDGRDHVLLVADAADPGACRSGRRLSCGRALVLRNPQPGFTPEAFDLDAPVAGADYVEDEYLPTNSQFDLVSTWRAPVPFDAVQAWSPDVLATCAGGRRCFALRFRPDGDVRPVYPAAVPAPEPAGFAFVLRPVEAPSAAAERRAIFVSFPGALVKTAAF